MTAKHTKDIEANQCSNPQPALNELHINSLRGDYKQIIDKDYGETSVTSAIEVANSDGSVTELCDGFHDRKKGH